MVFDCLRLLYIGNWSLICGIGRASISYEMKLARISQKYHFGGIFPLTLKYYFRGVTLCKWCPGCECGGGQVRSVSCGRGLYVGVVTTHHTLLDITPPSRGSRSIDLAVSKFSNENLFFKFRWTRSRRFLRLRFLRNT